MKKILITLTLAMSVFAVTFAQSALVGTGGEVLNNDGSVSFSVGQIAVQNSSDGTITISEGVQQPYEISVVGVDNYHGITLNAVVYPNPTVGELQLTIDNLQLEGEVKVFDVNGKFLFSKKIEGENTRLDLSRYATGTYYINVCGGKEVMKTFKVVKTGM